jgi:hypothetical protein
VTDVRRTLLRLALAACDRGDVLGARPLVAAVLDMPEEPESAGGVPHAESYSAFGQRIGVSARTVRAMVRDGRIAPESVIGTGRGRRVLVAEALSALRAPLSSVESDGARYIARRRLRVVRGAR